MITTGIPASAVHPFDRLELTIVRRSCRESCGERPRLSRSSQGCDGSRFSLARQHFEWVVRFFLDADATILRSLAGVYVVLGDMKSARSILRNRRRIFPDDTGLQNAEARFGK